MTNITIFLLFIICTNCVSDNHLFMNLHGKARSELKKEYQLCKMQLHADISSVNTKIENFDLSGMSRRGLFSSVDSGEQNTEPKFKVVRWPRGEVPVQLESGFSKAERHSLKCATLYFRVHTCLKFLIKNDTHVDYVYLMKTHTNGGCFTEVIGKKGGKQIINLDPTNTHCWEHGTIIHEIMHVLGFFHEHSRADRNKYVVVHWNNIPKPSHFQYWTTEDMGYEHKDVGRYDFSSVMHYNRYLGFSLALSAKLRNEQYQEQYENNDNMGQRIGPSDEDTNKLNSMYCPHIGKPAISDCNDELDCSGLESLCSNSDIIRKKCKSTCNLCDTDFMKENVQVALKNKCDQLSQRKYTAYVLDSCLVFNFNMTTFDNAHGLCNDFQNGHIIELTTGSHFDTLSDVLATWTGYDSVVIGLKRGLNKDWRWHLSNGRTAKARNLPWINSSNYEMCAEYRYSTGKLNNIGCNEIRRVVCQYYHTSKISCDLLWQYKYTAYALKSCLVLQEQYSNFRYGSESCVDFSNGHLVRLPNNKSYEIFKEVLGGWAGFNTLYVGLQRENSGAWRWYTKGEQTKIQIPWSKGEPSDDGACVEYSFNSKSLNDIPCTKLRQSVCQYDNR